MLHRFIVPALLLCFSAVASPSFAADPVFPGVTRLGMAPPTGMVPSAKFSGFELPGSDASIILSEFPKEAYDGLTKSLADQVLNAQSLQVTSRGKVDELKSENLLVVTEQKAQVGSVRRYLLAVKGDELTSLVTIILPPTTLKQFPDSEIRKSLATFVIRPPLSTEDQLAGLPFKISDIGGFRLIRTFAGNAAMFTDGPSDTIKGAEQPTVVIAIAFMGVTAADRETMGKRTLAALPQLRETRIDSDQMIGTGDNQASEIIASARAATNGDLLAVYQLIRFTKNGGYLRIVGQGKLDERDALIARFRKLAAATEAK